jgi:hypothetical protein
VGGDGPPPRDEKAVLRAAKGVQMQVEEQHAITPAQPSRDERLAAIVQEINAAHAECELSLRDGLAHAIKAGQLLIAAKELLDYGAWIPWLRANFAGSTRTAQAYMRVARMYPAPTAAEITTGTLLGYRAALRQPAHYTAARPLRRVGRQHSRAAGPRREGAPMSTTPEHCPACSQAVPTLLALQAHLQAVSDDKSHTAALWSLLGVDYTARQDDQRGSATQPAQERD